MPRTKTVDTARTGGNFAHGTPTLGSPAEGIILRQSGWAFLDNLSQYGDEAVSVINAVKGAKETKPAAAIEKPERSLSDNKTLWIVGAVVGLLVLVLVLKK